MLGIEGFLEGYATDDDLELVSCDRLTDLVYSDTSLLSQ